MPPAATGTAARTPEHPVYIRDRWQSFNPADDLRVRPRPTAKEPKLDTLPDGWVPEEFSGGFPGGIKWRITYSTASGWLGHSFWGLRGDSQFTRRLSDLAGNELAQLLWDLDCYQGLLERWQVGLLLPEFMAHWGTFPLIHEYLRPGREHWGNLALLVQEWLDEDDG